MESNYYLAPPKRCIEVQMLIQQLKELGNDGLVSKKNYNEIPPKTEYSLTMLGKSFVPILENIYIWGAKNKITSMKKI